jgi:hypothetical protein
MLKSFPASFINAGRNSVQLRPMVRRMAEALQFDVSLLERLYTGNRNVGVRRTMLNVGKISCIYEKSSGL